MLSHRKNINIVQWTFASAIVLFMPVVQSAEWSLTPSLSPSVEYDDNVFMSKDDKEGVFHYSFSPSLTLKRIEENNDVQLTAGYAIERYSSLSSLNRQNPFIRLNANRRSERSDWGLAINHSEQSSRDEAADDTGDFRTESTLTNQSISPSYSYRVSPRDVFSILGSYSKSTYSPGGERDNKTLLIDSSWKHDFSERFNGGIGITASKFESNNLVGSGGNKNYNVAISALADYKLSELWNITSKIGVRRLDDNLRDSFFSSGDSSGLSYDFNANRVTERDDLSIGFSRGLSLTSTEGVKENDTISLLWSRQFNEKLVARLSSTYQESDSETNLFGQGGKRKNFNFSPSLHWNMKENIGLGFRYSHRKQKTEDFGTASGNSVMITLDYDWDSIRLSR